MVGLSDCSAGRTLVNAMVAALLVWVQVGCVPALRSPAAPSPSDSLFAKTRLEAAIGEYWKMVLPRTPAMLASISGTADYLPQESTLDSRWQLQVSRRMRGHLRNVDPEALSPRDYATLETLERRLDEMAAAPGFDHLDLSVLSVGAGPLRDALTLLADHPLSSAGEGARFGFLLEDLGFWFLRVKTGLEEKWRRGILPTSAVASRFRETLEGLRQGELERLLSLGERVARLREGGDSLAVGLNAILGNEVFPALDSLIAFTGGPWARATRADGGLWRIPGGKEYYRFLLRRHTGLDVDPEAAHRAGLAQLRRLDSTLTAMRARNRWNPNPRQLHDSIRRSIDASRSTAQSTSDRVNGILDSLMIRGLDRFPARDSARVRARPASLKEEALEGQWFGATASEPAELPITAGWLSPSSLFSITSRAARLGWPGSALQQIEVSSNDSMPDFLRLHPSTAGVAGWAEYAAAAVGEVGAYERPEDAYAHVLRQAFNAALLVADTGIHYFGWTRSQVVGALAPWSIEDAVFIEKVVVDQVLSNPGRAGVEALALREMTAMRAWMEQELGSAFDVSEWHAEVLSSGPLPLAVLARHLEWWAWNVRRRKAGTPTSGDSGDQASLAACCRESNQSVSGRLADTERW